MSRFQDRLAALAGFAAVSALALGTGGTPAVAQQNPETIRGQCIEEVMKLYPDPDEQFRRARVQLYINCMTKHGLTP